MSKKTINVYEIHRVKEETSILYVGEAYAVTIKNGVKIEHTVLGKSKAITLKDGRKAIKYKVSFIEELKDEFIKTLADEFTHAYIIIAPDKKGIIVDFSLPIDAYDKITEKLKIKK